VTRLVLRRRHVPSFGGLKTVFISTDGACPGNGGGGGGGGGGGFAAQAGWAFIFGPGSAGTVKGPLEQKGPDGQVYAATSNRAELRGVIAALEFRVWWGEGWDRLIIVTESEYVANGATVMVAELGRVQLTHVGGARPWQIETCGRKLSELMGIMAEGGCEISFWRVPRAKNTGADQAAKAADERGEIKIAVPSPMV